MEIKPRIQSSQKMLLGVLRLRPYGDSLLTPAVTTWLGFAWVIILLMASSEGIVWGLVGATLVPRDSIWLAPFAGLFMFLLMFAIIWIVDASLIMSERPLLRSRRWNPGQNQGFGALLRWAVGILVRLTIVAVSLYVTAPFLAKLIRADDIAAHHQRQVEHYFSQRDMRVQSLIDARTTQIRHSHREQIEPLEQEIERLTESIARERERRAAIEAEYAPEIAILRQDLAAARVRIGDEILGRDGRPEGRGPEARKWEANANLIAGQLAAKQSELDARAGAVVERIETLEQSLRTRTDTLQRLTQTHQRDIERIGAEIAAEQVDAQPPKLSFAARSTALHALRESPDEQGVPHFETVEGFAQAALGVLFFSLIALKLFEPVAVRAYFSETIQMQYRKYLDGGLDDIPGFERSEDPAQRLNAVEFVRLWSAYENDPAAFYADRQTLIEVREPLAQFLAEQSIEHDRLIHRREQLEHTMHCARLRQEHELTAYERELAARTAQLQAQLANETKALKDQRRIALATELQHTRADWHARKSRAEEELRQLREGFEHEQMQAHERLRLRELEIEQLREQSQAEVRVVEIAKEHAQQYKRITLEHKQRREIYKIRASGMREEVTRLRALETKQRAERETLSETDRKLRERIGTIKTRIETIKAELAEHQAQAASLAEQAHETEPAGTQKARFWSRSSTIADTRAAREIARELKSTEKAEQAATEQLARLREELHALQLRKTLNDSELAESVARIETTGMRIQLYEDGLSTLHAPDLAETPSEPSVISEAD